MDGRTENRTPISHLAKAGATKMCKCYLPMIKQACANIRKCTIDLVILNFVELEGRANRTWINDAYALAGQSCHMFVFI